ncbi:hypothetical protein C7H79_08120 [Nitrosomonas supralitoralis]|uniref:Uncharacterized protein n=2 Tax=Nitrosomonas supralitoralis TaxID=2116706 RepID=A0A2P7NVE5_9PROT|nr:hypothetical protein C7H79_08120 [Nitrosomonas supralitoralis]
MGIDWDKFRKELDQVIDEAGDRTDNKLAGKISAITRLSDAEVEDLFPDPAEVKKLAELMAIIKHSGDQNDKINKIVGNAEEFGGIILKLLTKFV